LYDSEDFSVAVGLKPGSSTQPPSSLGNFVHNFDLENTGHGSQLGSFTLQVPMPKSIFSNGNGKYFITTAVTNAVGVSLHAHVPLLLSFLILLGVLSRRLGTSSFSSSTPLLPSVVSERKV
jgi:hypothetical protein